MTRTLLLCALLGLAQQARAQTEPEAAPDAAAQKSFLEAVARNTVDYDQGLPDFVCTEITRRSQAKSGAPERWRQLDTLEEEVTYFGRHENHKPVKINGKATGVAHTRLKGFRSDGMFGGLLSWIFNPKAETAFDWARWDTPGGRRMCVFSFHVAQKRSRMQVGVGGKTVTAGFHGLVYVDGDSKTVMRLRAEGELPADFPVQSNSLEVWYGPAAISGQEYFLPLRAEARVLRGNLLVRNEVEFAGYHKYTADTTVTFEGSPKR